MYACAALVGLATGIVRPVKIDGRSQLELVKVVMACLLREVRFRGHSKFRDKLHPFARSPLTLLLALYLLIALHLLAALRPLAALSLATKIPTFALATTKLEQQFRPAEIAEAAHRRGCAACAPPQPLELRSQ